MTVVEYVSFRPHGLFAITAKHQNTIATTPLGTAGRMDALRLTQPAANNNDIPVLMIAQTRNVVCEFIIKLPPRIRMPAILPLPEHIAGNEEDAQQDCRSE